LICVRSVRSVAPHHGRERFWLGYAKLSVPLPCWSSLCDRHLRNFSDPLWDFCQLEFDDHFWTFGLATLFVAKYPRFCQSEGLPEFSRIPARCTAPPSFCSYPLLKWKFPNKSQMSIKNVLAKSGWILALLPTRTPFQGLRVLERAKTNFFLLGGPFHPFFFWALIPRSPAEPRCFGVGTIPPHLPFFNLPPANSPNITLFCQKWLSPPPFFSFFFLLSIQNPFKQIDGRTAAFIMPNTFTHNDSPYCLSSFCKYAGLP